MFPFRYPAFELISDIKYYVFIKRWLINTFLTKLTITQFVKQLSAFMEPRIRYLVKIIQKEEEEEVDLD